MIYYKVNKVNEDYFSLEPAMLRKIWVSNDFSVNTCSLADQIYFVISEYEKKHDVKISDINISNDSLIGEAIHNNPRLFLIGRDSISYDDVVNAYNIAVFEDNVKMANKVGMLFKGRISGRREFLEESVSDAVLDYIVSHDSFQDFLDDIDGVLNNKKFFVYENGTIQEKSLAKKPKEIVKKIG